MRSSRIVRPPTHRRAERRALVLAACLVLAFHGPTRAEDRALSLQGLFCNSEDQIDGAVAHIGQGRSPRAAAALANKDAVVCTYVDLLRYVVVHPVQIGDSRRLDPLGKYRGMLTAVVAGQRLRAVSPPVEVFFITPERLAGAVVERRS